MNIKKLGDVIKITKGKKVNYGSFGKYNYIDIGILRTNQIKEFTDDENGVFCDEKDILIAWDGSKSGTIGFGLKGVIGSTLAKLKIIDENISSQFLGKLLQSKFDYLNENTSGAAIPHIRKDILENILVPVPDLETQKEIVKKLDNIFENIENSKNQIKNQIKNLDDMWASSLDKIFSNEEWEKKKVENLIFKSTQSNPKNFPNEKFTYLDISSVDKNIQKITNPNNFLGKDAPSRAKKNVKKGDIIFATTRPNLKNIAIVENDFENLVASTGFCILSPNQFVERNYLFYFLTSDFLQIKISPYIRGAQYPAISDKDLLNIKFPVPDLETQKNIVSYLDNLNTQILELKNLFNLQLKNFDQLWASCLDQAFKGNL